MPFALSLILALFASMQQILQAEEPARQHALSGSRRPIRVVRLQLPIRDRVDTQVRGALEHWITGNSVTGNSGDFLEGVAGESEEEVSQGTEDSRPIVVLEFWPPDQGSGDGSEFGRALDLARFLASSRMRGVRTVAYLPQTVRGHAVLVALACEEIIMHPDAMFGDAGVSEENIDLTVRRGYEEIADRRRTIPAAVALGMLDRTQQVLRVTTPGGVRYLMAEELDATQREVTVQSIDTVIPRGESGLFSGDRMRLEFGFASHLARNREELATALHVNAADLEIDTAFGGEWKAIRVDVNGPIHAGLVDRILRSVEDRLEGNPVNLIAVVLNSPGGDPEQSFRLANYLARFDPNKIRTVAYVIDEARGDASIVALSCDQLVMETQAILGGGGATALDPKEIELTRMALADMLTKKGRHWSLPTALFDPTLEVHRYQFIGTTRTAYFSETELQGQADPGRWERKEKVSREGILELNAHDAHELGLARFVVTGMDQFEQELQLSEPPESLKPNWAHDFVAALASPRVAAGLLFIGAIALIIEMSAPGLGVGGFVAAICFLLFFWSNFLQGTAGWLEVLLFVTGLFFIAMEIFVVPGFGIFGLGGGAMVLLSLVLASQTFVIPRNDYQVGQFSRSLFAAVAVMLGLVTGGVLLQKYFVRAPFMRRLMLQPPQGAELVERERREQLVTYQHLLGRSGFTTTPLIPSGKATIDGLLVDVVSDGEAVETGKQVKVLEVVGNRIIVRAVS